MRDIVELLYSGYEDIENAFELYNWVSDPEELHDLYQIESSIAAQLQFELEAKLDQVNQPFN